MTSSTGCQFDFKGAVVEHTRHGKVMMGSCRAVCLWVQMEVRVKGTQENTRNILLQIDNQRKAKV